MTHKLNNNNRVSLAEVARAAGVSKMTASRVVREDGGYTEATRTKVLAEVERLGYLPNRLASVFAGDRKSTFIGVSIPDLGNEVFTQVLDGIDRRLGSFGYQTVLGLTQHTLEEEEAWIRTVLSWQPAGLILTGRSHSARTTDMLRSAGIPIVEIWDHNARPLDMCVGISHFDSGFEMGRYLIECGYLSLGYVVRLTIRPTQRPRGSMASQKQWWTQVERSLNSFASMTPPVIIPAIMERNSFLPQTRKSSVSSIRTIQWPLAGYSFVKRGD